jgi:hypothetical protein
VGRGGGVRRRRVGWQLELERASVSAHLLLLREGGFVGMGTETAEQGALPYALIAEADELHLVGASLETSWQHPLRFE